MKNWAKMFCNEMASEAYSLSKMQMNLENAAMSHYIRNPADFTSVSEQLRQTV
jgi:hypothetical protein